MTINLNKKLIIAASFVKDKDCATSFNSMVESDAIVTLFENYDKCPFGVPYDENAWDSLYYDDENYENATDTRTCVGVQDSSGEIYYLSLEVKEQ